MSETDRRPVLATLLTVLGCLAMLWVEWVLSPVYPVKSSAKALVFLGCAAAYVLASGDRTILRSFGRPEQGAMRLPLLLGGGVFLLLLGGYTLLSPWLDLSAISGPVPIRLQKAGLDLFRHSFCPVPCVHHGRLVPPGPAGPAYLWAGLRRASVQRSGRKKPDHMARLAGPHGGQPGHQHHRPSPVGDHLTKGECPAPSVCWPWYPIWLMKQQVGLCGSHRV